MAQSSSRGTLSVVLESIDDVMGERTPEVRAFVETLRERDRLLAEGGMGVTTETLVVDLVGLLSSFELRLAALDADR